MGRLNVRGGALVVVEHTLIVSILMIAASIRGFSFETITWGLAWRSSLIGAVLQLCLHYCDLYDLRSLSDRRGLVIGLIRSLGAASVILALLYFWVPALRTGRGVIVIATFPIIALVAGVRFTFEWLSLRIRPAERLLIVGTNGAAVNLAKELWQRRHELGVELVGFVDTDPAKIGTPLINPGVIGAIGQIPDIVRERKVDRVVVSLADARGKLSMNELLAMKLNEGIRFDHLASVYEQYTGKIAVENLRPSWMIFSEGFRKSRFVALGKRCIDFALASIGLLIAAPVMAAVAAAIRASSPGPVLYHQTRVGKNGRTFTIHKFRSMRVDAEARTGPVWSGGQADPRVTRLGRLMRRTRLDELPQLWNVLAGDMSFVGPRPERPEFVAELTKQIPYYGERHVVRPGLTGWAQVRHVYASTIEDSLEKLQYDLFYIKHMSLAFDLFIALDTVKTVLVRRGS
jgi:sugar transferase (PEP-CTERM system associated)